MQDALDKACVIAAKNAICIILPMDRPCQPGFLNVVFVIEASIVFHPHFNGSNTYGTSLTEWGHKDNPYYEKAAMLRAMENTIYFASCNYASPYPELVGSIIDPAGNCIAQAAYGKTGVITADTNPALATGLLAKGLNLKIIFNWQTLFHLKTAFSSVNRLISTFSNLQIPKL